MAEGDGTFALPTAAAISRPSPQEVIRLHRELQIWMMHTRYQLQGMDNQPVWRMHNTSLVFGTGAGIGSYYILERYLPKFKFPINIIPPMVLFYFTYRATQVQQLPALYTSILSLPTPLGGKGRDVLSALRSGGWLPSQEFANQKPPTAGDRAVAAPVVPAAVAATLADAAPPAWAPQPDVVAPGPAASESSVFQTQAMSDSFAPGIEARRPDVAASDPKPAPPADPWGDDAANLGGAALGSEGDAWGAAEQAPAAPTKQKTSWELIRARQAAGAAERQDRPA